MRRSRILVMRQNKVGDDLERPPRCSTPTIMASGRNSPQGAFPNHPPAPGPSSSATRRRPQNPPRHSAAQPSRSSSPAPSTSSSSPSGSGAFPPTNVDTMVTRLLVSTKTLLEGLTQWSLRECSDSKISDMYVKLGNDLNTTCATFARANVPMSDLLKVPDDLRPCLEACLSEDQASPATLERHLPAIKAIIVRLLQGLKAKQALYKSMIAQQRASQVPPVPQIPSPTSSTASRVTSPPPAPSTSTSATTQHRPQSTHRKMSSLANSVSSSSSDTPASTTTTEERPGPDRTSVGSASAASRHRLTRSNSSYTTMSESTTTTSARAASPTSAPFPRSQSAGSVGQSTTAPPPAMPPPAAASRSSALPSFHFEPAPLPKPSTSAANGPEEEDQQLSRPRLPSTMASSGHKQQQHSTDKSFETLKNQDNLVRRASKRFSRYTLDKMTGSPGRDDSSSSLGGVSGGVGASPTASPRRSFKPPPVPTSSRVMPPPNGHGSLQPGPPSASDSWNAHIDDLEEKQRQSVNAARGSSDKGDHLDSMEHHSPTRGAQLSPLPEHAEAASPVPAQHGHDDGQEHEQDTSRIHQDAPSGPVPTTPSATAFFLQLGRQTKKASLDPDQMPPTLASLQVLFMDRFSYNAGQDDFPMIYIRDPRLGLEYELEDLSEVREGCLLILNVEPMDQVKQHIDTALSSITLELKDLKLAMSTTRRSTPAPPMGWSPSLAGMSSPTLGQGPIPAAARRQSTISEAVVPPPPPKTPTAPSMPDHMSTSLRRYQDEVQSVRRDLAGLRQIYSEYSTDHKNIMSSLRTQLERVKTVANTKVSGSRAFIDAGKTKLDGQSQDLLTKIETLMDTVEIMREDVTVRRMRPAPHKMEDLRKQIETSRSELDDVLAYMTTVRPAWKKTWSEELQNVVEEQRFLKHQEELLEEMSEDHKEMAGMFENIDELMKKMAPSPGASGQPKGGPRMGLREYIPPEVDRDHQGLSTVMTEVRSLSVDPDRRLRAIQEAEKAREVSRTENKDNEFAKELGGFVDSKQLRKTGGAEEAERVRQLKNQDALKSMFAAQVALPDSPDSASALTAKPTNVPDSSELPSSSS